MISKPALLRLSLSLIIVLGLGVGIQSLYTFNQPLKITGATDVAPVTRIALHENFFDERRFRQSQKASAAVSNVDHVQLVIVPHHTLASEIISKVLAGVQSDVKRIIILAPYHAPQAPASIFTGLVAWETPFGVVEADREREQRVQRELGISHYEAAFVEEHSAGALAPFIKTYFPEADVVPILLHASAAATDVDRLVAWLDSNVDETTLVIVSIDFSHYLPQAKAQESDERTRRIIEQRDATHALQLNNDHVDSPQALATALLLARARELNLRIMYHANSNDFLETARAQTTSYFGILGIAQKK